MCVIHITHMYLYMSTFLFVSASVFVCYVCVCVEDLVSTLKRQIKYDVF